MNQPYKIFIIYSHQDEDSRRELATHLLPMERANQVSVWADHKLLPGDVWEPAIKAQLGKADLVLLLVSPDYFRSDYIHEVELKEALTRHERNEARIIPIIVRPCDWESDRVISRIQMLPTKAVAINDTRYWPNRDFAWDDVVKGIKLALQQLQAAEIEVERKRVEEEKRRLNEFERAEMERKLQAEEKRRKKEIEQALEEQRRKKKQELAEAERKKKAAEQLRQEEIRKAQLEQQRQESERKRLKEFEADKGRLEEEKEWGKITIEATNMWIKASDPNAIGDWVRLYRRYIKKYPGKRSEYELIKVRRGMLKGVKTNDGFWTCLGLSLFISTIIVLGTFFYFYDGPDSYQDTHWAIRFIIVLLVMLLVTVAVILLAFFLGSLFFYIWKWVFINFGWSVGVGGE